MDMLPPVPAESDWFPVRITSIPVAGQYIFQEVWLTTLGVNADRVGGRVNTANDPAIAIDGNTFAVTAAGTPVQAFARRGPGAGGSKWELNGRAALGTFGSSAVSPFNIPNTVLPGTWLTTGDSITLPSSGTYMVAASVAALAYYHSIMMLRFVDAATGIAVPLSEIFATRSDYDSGLSGTIAAASMGPVFITVVAATVIQLQAQSSGFGAPSTPVGQILNGVMSYLKLD